MYGFKTEPILITAFVGALLFALVEFGVPLTDGQETAIQGLVAAALAFFARSQVTSQATLIKAAGPDAVQKVEEAANDRGLTMNVVSKMAAMLLALALFSSACANNPNPTDRPDQVVAKAATYGAQVVGYATDAQKMVNAYAVAQGGRTAETDRVSAAIRDKVIPQAERLKVAFNVYAVASNTVAQAAAQKDILSQLDLYQQLFESVLKTDVPNGLVGDLTKTILSVKTLADEIRNAFLKPQANALPGNGLIVMQLAEVN